MVLVAVGAVLTVIVIIACMVLLSLVDLPANAGSTAALIYVWIPIYAFGAIVLIWIGVLVAWLIRDDRRHRPAKFER
jgi:hypothetical protein